MKIIFCDSLPTSSNQIDYCNFKLEDLNLTSARYHDLRSLAQIHEKKFFKQIELWFAEVNTGGLETTDSWWLTQCSRLMSWDPPVYTPLFFNYLISQLDLGEIYILNAPREVVEISNDFFPQIEKLSSTDIKLMKEVGIYNNHLKPYLAYLKNYLYGKVKPQQLEPRPFLIYSAVLNKDNLLKNLDHYFGAEFFKIELLERKKITWLFHYPPNDKKIKKELIKHFTQLGFQIVFTSDYLSLFEILKMFGKSISLKLKLSKLASLLPPLKIDNKVRPLFNNIFSQVLKTKQDSLAEFELAYSLSKILPQLKSQKILYPFEDRSIERSLLIANNLQTKPATTMGFVHSVMHDGHLCYNILIKTNPPRPDFVLTTGEAALQWFINKGYAKSNLKIIGSPRSVANFIPIKSVPENLKILFLVGQAHELISFASMIGHSTERLKDIQLTVRRYPYGWFEDQERGVMMLKKIIPNLIEEKATLSEQLLKNDLVFFSTSSSGIEAIMNGKLAFYLKLDKLHNLNPLEYAKAATALIQCNDAESLIENLQKIKKLNCDEWNNLIQSQMKDAQLIYQKFDTRIFTK